MESLEEYVWYASYGSNLFKTRFECYLKGGTPIGSEKLYNGCTDKSSSIKIKEVTINHELYFAKYCKNWKGGVAFIDTRTNPNVKTLGKMYLITKGQFIDIYRQETLYFEELNIDFDRAIQMGSYVFRKGSWYGNLIYLGTDENFPIFTFAYESNIETYVKPSESYVTIIARGIMESYNVEKDNVISYLLEKKGIVGKYTRVELDSIVNKIKVSIENL